jgi:hypothetical protein
LELESPLAKPEVDETKAAKQNERMIFISYLTMYVPPSAANLVSEDFDSSKFAQS